MIPGVKIFPLKQFADRRGIVKHMLRCTDDHFRQFGEIYFSQVEPGVLKGWHLHKKMTLNYACIYGRVLVGLVDGRRESPEYGKAMHVALEEYGDDYKLLIIPPGVLNGFRSAEESPIHSIIANCATLPHDPDEIIRVHPMEFEFDFDWGEYEIAG
jgi:dTDP-4-dehydrorhamnose 3,5-epimerase